MRLSSLNLVSNMRVIQPNASDALQNKDFEFELTRNAVMSESFYELVFYKLMNGYVSGIDAGSIHCGFKFVVYDNNNSVLFETPLEKLDKYLTEAKTIFEIETEYVLPDATVDVWVSRVDLEFIANNGTAAETYTVFESTAPQKCTFSEQIDASQPDKAIKIIGGEDSKLMFNFKMEL